jgi:hypothetical protein
LTRFNKCVGFSFLFRVRGMLSEQTLVTLSFGLLSVLSGESASLATVGAQHKKGTAPAGPPLPRTPKL